jgi:apolipoprotein D and lipocalin family protein
MRFKYLLLAAFAVQAAESTQDIPLVQKVDLARYVGKWYEIARFPHRFEKNLSHVTATYTLRDDGRVTVLNEGRKKNGKPSSITGKAWIPDTSAPGLLKVSFFLFFSSDYRIILLDEDYQYAVVTSSERDYLWILCRAPRMEPQLYARLVNFVKAKGFDTGRIQKVAQD